MGNGDGRNPAECRRDGSDCGIHAGMDFITAGTPHWTIYVI